MQNLPAAKVYEKEFKYMPWGILIHSLLDVIKNTKRNAKVLDLMCGPGYLLGKINKIRPDLILTGVDLENEFINHAKNKYKKINFINEDAFKWNSKDKFDLIIVTAGVHHLPWNKQEKFIKKISTLLNEKGKVIIADPYIGNYSNEKERKLTSAKLGYEYLVATIENGGTNDVIKAAIDVMSNDIFLIEWKNSINKIETVVNKYFKKVKLVKTWPKIKSKDFGDYYFILSND